MTPILSPTERERLVAILGMLGSNFDGERASAGLLAHRLLTEKNLRWDDVVLQPSPPATSPRTDPINSDWRRMAASCSRYPDLLDRWETDFLNGLPRFPRLSVKQRSILSKI